MAVSDRKKQLTSFAKQVNNEQYHSDHCIFTAIRCILFLMLGGGEEGEGSFSFSSERSKLESCFSKSDESNLKKNNPSCKRHAVLKSLIEPYIKY